MTKCNQEDQCSFCGKTRSQAGTLIPGNHEVFICEACGNSVAQIVAEGRDRTMAMGRQLLVEVPTPRSMRISIQARSLSGGEALFQLIAQFRQNMASNVREIDFPADTFLSPEAQLVLRQLTEAGWTVTPVVAGEVITGYKVRFQV